MFSRLDFEIIVSSEVCGLKTVQSLHHAAERHWALQTLQWVQGGEVRQELHSFDDHSLVLLKKVCYYRKMYSIWDPVIGQRLYLLDLCNWVGVCFFIIFLLSLWRPCFGSGPQPMIFLFYSYCNAGCIAFEQRKPDVPCIEHRRCPVEIRLNSILRMDITNTAFL